jgi:hypothetical protein
MVRLRIGVPAVQIVRSNMLVQRGKSALERGLQLPPNLEMHPGKEPDSSCISYGVRWQVPVLRSCENQA